MGSNGGRKSPSTGGNWGEIWMAYSLFPDGSGVGETRGRPAGPLDQRATWAAVPAGGSAAEKGLLRRAPRYAVAAAGAGAQCIQHLGPLLLGPPPPNFKIFCGKIARIKEGPLAGPQVIQRERTNSTLRRFGHPAKLLNPTRA